jgi:hypothetical protein
MSDRAVRKGDGGKEAKLEILLDPDGDIFVSIKSPEGERIIDFANTVNGGGKSPHTIEALHKLKKAMELDNDQSPL